MFTLLSAATNKGVEMKDESKVHMTLNLKVWRQKSPDHPGKFVDYKLNDISPDMSFLEMIDVLNQQLIKAGEEPVAFEHDCREGICGSCSMVINGNPHGPDGGTATCQLHMRKFKNEDSITVEPWRAKAFPLIKDLVVNRSALDRIIASGGYVSVNTGNAREANALPIAKDKADRAFDYATCIGCGACVAACKNASASLFTAAKIAQLELLPQGEPERARRVIHMVAQMDKEGFGACSNTGSCSAACPKSISLESITRMNQEYSKALLGTLGEA
jgi:succinate dehydrogenase / fumarate reductase iron-sulfur subunit